MTLTMCAARQNAMITSLSSLLMLVGFLLIVVVYWVLFVNIIRCSKSSSSSSSLSLFVDSDNDNSMMTPTTTKSQSMDLNSTAICSPEIFRRY